MTFLASGGSFPGCVASLCHEPGRLSFVARMSLWCVWIVVQCGSILTPGPGVERILAPGDAWPSRFNSGCDDSLVAWKAKEEEK